MSSYIVPDEIKEIRIDTFLSQQLDTPRNKIQQIVRSGRVWVGTSIAIKPARPIKAGEVITITDDWKTREFPPAEPIDLGILYEDEDLLVINKASGMVVHPINKEGRGTVVNALLHKYPAIKEAVYDADNQVSLLRPGIVHRLDKDTSGVVLIAKNLTSMTKLAAQFQNHEVEKEYETLLYGNLAEQADVHTSMRRQKKGNVSRMKANRDIGEGREAHSIFTPVQHYILQTKILTQAKVQILTGRTHQIRSHAHYLGHPVIGDLIYGTASSKNLSKKNGILHHILHAYKLTFTHPTTGERITITAPQDSNFSTLISNLEPL